jgi:hypothetical protein
MSRQAGPKGDRVILAIRQASQSPWSALKRLAKLGREAPPCHIDSLRERAHSGTFPLHNGRFHGSGRGRGRLAVPRLTYPFLYPARIKLLSRALLGSLASAVRGLGSTPGGAWIRAGCRRGKGRRAARGSSLLAAVSKPLSVIRRIEGFESFSLRLIPRFLCGSAVPSVWTRFLYCRTKRGMRSALGRG